MRGLLALLIIALIAFSAFNYLQVNQLRQEVAQLQTTLHAQPQAQPQSDASDKALADVTRALARAREALTNMDGRSARGSLDTAREKLDEAGKTAGEKTRSAVKWLGEQTSELGNKIQDRAKQGG